jgi:predicted ester cyclase
MSIKTNERPQHAAAIDAAEHNRIVASQWIDAFNARDDAAEAAARTADYIAHAPDSIQPTALDSDAWVEFLGGFVEGFPDLQLEVLDSSADDVMVAQRILFTGTHTGPFRGLPPTGRKVRFSGLEINRMVDGRVAEHWFPGHAVRAAGPARRPRPAVACAAYGLAGHEAVEETAPRGPVIGTVSRAFPR